ncbi:MAG: membrane protein insertion efficiency factor YidD [Synergistaceae bacterium]|nr:membrane protein insertion efficiency factor YidD [Synergistaceae bacterium]
MGANVVAWGAIRLIRGYQKWISPLLGPRCRFYPSCSQYAILALAEWGFYKGSCLAIKRIARCGPWHEGGYDPPPCKKRNKHERRKKN